MAHLWKKSLLLATSMVLPTFALTACAGDSQYGTVATLNYAYDNDNNTNTENDFSDLKNQYGFNNWTDTDATFQKSGNDWKSYSSSGYVKSISQIAITVGLFAQNLVRASLVGFTDKTTNIPIFSNGTIPTNSSDRSNSPFLQFLYAASDLLNFGQANQIGFGLTGITTEISAPINPQLNGNLQVVDKDNKQVGYTNPNANITFIINFGYWHTGTNSPTSNGGVKASDIQNYVDTYNVWSQKFNTYYTTFTVQLNLQARIQSVFTMGSDWGSNYNWSNGDYLKNNGNNYNISSDDLSNFITGSNSNFSSFNMQFEPSVDVSSNFLKQFGAYDSTTPFGSTTSGDAGTYSTFETQYNNLNNLFSSNALNPSDFANYYNVLSFSGAS